MNGYAADMLAYSQKSLEGQNALGNADKSAISCASPE
jgi:hypothetical protein